MNICIDVGNSTIGIGAFKDNKLVERMVVNTDPHFTEDEFYQLFKKPFAHISSGKGTIAFESWPTYDESKLAVNTIKIAVQVNGKLRGELNVSPDESEENLKALALELDGVKRNTEGKEIKKIIVVKGRIINIVAI